MKPTVPRCPHRHRLGLTLMEVLISLILVSTILLVSITASANLLRNSFAKSSAHLADQLASQILDEISAKDFRDTDADAVAGFGLEADESNVDRMTFDDVDDYHNYSSSPPSHRDGTAIDGYAGWTFTITVQRAEAVADTIVTTINDDSMLRLVTIACTSPASEVTSRSMLVSNVPTAVSETISFEKWRRVKFTFPDGRDVIISAPLVNQPEVATY